MYICIYVSVKCICVYVRFYSFSYMHKKIYIMGFIITKTMLRYT